MEKIKVLMIDDNTSLVEMVKEYFSDHKKIAVIVNNNCHQFLYAEQSKMIILQI